MRFRQQYTTVKWTLALWLLVVTTAPAFSHEHPGGDKPHAHGLGLFSSATPNGKESSNDLTPTSRHFHLVIFGIEIHVAGHGSPVESENSCCPSEHGLFQLNADSGSSAGLTGDNVCTGDRHDMLPAIESRPAEPGVIEGALAGHRPDLVPSPCDVARGLRSGTQQI